MVPAVVILAAEASADEVSTDDVSCANNAEQQTKANKATFFIKIL
jgi:hypothetical protein